MVGIATPVAVFIGEVNVTAEGAPAEIDNCTVVTFVPEALLPVIVIVYVPGVARAVLDIVKVLVPIGVTEAEEKEDVAPAGTPVTERFTRLLYPPIDPTLIVNTALFG